MIEGYKKETHHLSKDEYAIRDILIRAFKTMKPGYENVISGPIIIGKLESLGYDIPDSRLRKMIQNIRVNGLVHGLCSNNKGYWIRKSEEEFKKTLKSLKDRIESHQATYDKMYKEYLKEYGYEKEGPKTGELF